jgi:hypothetical protein
LRQDPVVALESRRLKALYIDCGEKDQFNLLDGARRFVRRLTALGIAHRYEEFPDNHSSVLSNGRKLAVSRVSDIRLILSSTRLLVPTMFPPERIVCLTEETVETLYLLGEQDRIVGISGYCVRPPEARRDKPRLASPP